VTLIEAEPRAVTASEDATPTVLASWPARARALCLDVLPGAAVLATTALAALSVPLRGGWWWVSVCIGAVAVLWTGFNRLLLPGANGQSLGRRTFGVAVVRPDGSAVGPVTLLLRDLAHLLDTVPVFAGWLWPVKDARRRTFADMLLRTESHVVKAHGADGSACRRAAAVVLTAASLCAVEAAVSYTVVHHHDRSVAEASAEIAAQGPRMVEQILSYHPETIQADFDRARSLATDTYRGQLSAQQQVVQKAAPVRNEYWVTNSSVLSATQGRATMLLFLQGQRGAAPNQRYITASVRVTFVESGSAPWRVDDLTVVNNPPPVKAKP
jgi:Mce-associated membrane protein